MAQPASIHVGGAVVTLTHDGCVSTYPDGSSFEAQPHDTPHYHVIAHRLGYGDDLLRYCREHEVTHHLVGETFYGGRSPVISQLAAGYDPIPVSAAIEEAMVMTVQRWLRANERPIIGGVDWDAVRYRGLALLDG